MIKCWEKRTEAILPVFFRFLQVSFYIEIFENFYTKCLQVRKIYLSLHSRLRKTSNTAEHGAVVQLVRMRACHARGRGFEPHPHRLKALHESAYMAPSVAEKYGVPLLGQIPIVQSIRENGDEGEPAALSSRPDGLAFLNLAEKLVKSVEMP